ATLRPNQLLAVSLPFSPLDVVRQRQVVSACGGRLFAATGLRSLDPREGRYVGRYGGPPAIRDGAYHQGTSWVWLLGVFALAYARAFRDAAGARAYLESCWDALHDACLGQLGELADGDAPFEPKGAFAQAWSVAEVVRAWHDAPHFAG
ncbi:MAG: glycogen debranching protein, partial [Candidatus Eremiobacteraeota bacterium]|nr:glycogen debranching protein [Candidatus Eremiobacteraeota bacterium]